MYCVKCSDKSTDFSLGNNAILKYNSEHEAIYAQGYKAWDEYLVRKAKGEAISKPIGLKELPQKWLYMDLTIQCMCHYCNIT